MLAIPTFLSTFGTLRSIASTLLGALALVTPVQAQYQLVWEDNFNGSSLDLSKWAPQVGNGCPSLCGWGNNELQFYRAENATVSGGELTIIAKQQSFGGAQYTSARLRTKGLGDWKYGRFEMRAKLPTGRGLWPAFWMLPTDSVYGTWAASGEIDIMELVGHEPHRTHGTIHYGAPAPGNVYSGEDYTLPSGTFNDDFHVFAIEWDEFEMRWYVDGIQFSTRTSWWSSAGPYPAPFDERFHLLLNLAVGGDWPGPPNGATVFPQEFVVDYVRVYQDNGHDLSTCLCTFDDMEHADPFNSGYYSFDGLGGGGINASLADVPPVHGGNASLEAGWGSGGTAGYFGGFGRTYPLNLTGATHFDFWINPDPDQDYVLEINLQDDDNGDDSVPSVPDGVDDEFQYELHVSPTGPGAISGGGWQRISIPLTDFYDDNTFHFGGNGLFDPTPSSVGGNGQLANIVMVLVSNTGQNVTFRTDKWMFTRRASSVGGRVWNDLDSNGLDFGEPGLSGVTVELLDTNLGSVLTTDVTDTTGAYDFPDQLVGQLTIRVDASTLPVGATATVDPDGLLSLHEYTLELGCDESFQFQDFGYAPGPSTNYCQGEPNSVGPGSTISSSGSDSVSENSFSLSAVGAIPNGFGIFYYGPNEIDVPFGEGRRCVGGSVLRLSPATLADGSGNSTRPLDFTSPTGSSINANSTWKFQYWYRDPAGGPSGFNLSDGLSVTFTP
ncbi:MAG: beta-glucanase (GH16 family) [Planctomycetota bacterium]|jgi:beta-glucanase (GH16 family)